jgi:hypothetical protein
VREDSLHVDSLQRRLEEAGVRVWRDTADLWPGEDWRRKFRQAIQEDALVFIACFSQRSLARKTSFQNEELTWAIEQLRRRRPDDPWLIPVRFSDCDIPDLDIGADRTLRSIQRADLFGERSDEGALCDGVSMPSASGGALRRIRCGGALDLRLCRSLRQPPNEGDADRPNPDTSTTSSL